MSLPPKKTILILAASLIIGSGGALVYWQTNRSDDQPEVTQDTGATAEQEQAEVNQNKEEQKPPAETPETSPPATTPPAATKKSVKPFITYAGYSDDTKSQVEVDAYVPQIFEDGGTCTMTAVSKNGEKTINKQTSAFKNVNTTSCNNFLVDTAEFASLKSWTVTVSYVSGTSEGTSDPKAMEL